MRVLIALAALAAGPLLAGAANARNRFGAMPEPTLSPRYYLEASPLKALGKRQAVCSENFHPCDDIGAVGAGHCCQDNTYCIVDPDDDTKPSCCAIGSQCGSACAADKYQCNATTTITAASSTTTSLIPACCSRRCPRTSMFGCPLSMGNGCCFYGQVCGSSSICLSTSTASSSVSAVVTEIPAGCTTSQIACPSSLGGGCCANTQVCTSLSGAARCAPSTVVPTGSGVAVAQNNELSTGAKAGIGVGVVIGAGVVIGLVTWWCVRQRHRRSQAASSQRRSVPQIVGGGGRAMTETNSDTVSRGGPLRPVTQDYFGANPAVGPYSDPGHAEVTSVGTSPGHERGVPVEPHGPGDITAPVEIDSRSSPGALGPDETLSQGTRSNRSSVMHAQQVPNTIEGRFELYGDDTGLSPYIPSPNTETPQMQTPPEHPLAQTPQTEQTPQTVQTPQTEELYETPMSPQDYHYTSGHGQAPSRS